MENKFLDVLCYLECAINMDGRDLITISNATEEIVDKCLCVDGFDEDETLGDLDEFFDYLHNDFAEDLYGEIINKEDEFKDFYVYKDGIMLLLGNESLYIRAE